MENCIDLEMAKSFSFNDFPTLQIDGEDMSGSFNKWLEVFDMVLEMQVIDLGNNEEGESRVTDRMKLLGFFKSIGSEGREILAAKGLTLNAEGSSYNRARAALIAFYKKTESHYVKTARFTSVRQGAGEDPRDYLKRVESLSRDLGFLNMDPENIRMLLALSVAVNGLRDKNLCKELISKTDLTWDRLGEIIRGKLAVQESMEQLEGDLSSAGMTVRVKKEVASVESRKTIDTRALDVAECKSESKSSRNTARERESTRDQSKVRGNWRERSRSYSPSKNRQTDREHNRGRSQVRLSWRERSQSRSRSPSKYRREGKCFECGSRNHVARYCPEVRCYQCGERGHQSRDCMGSANRRNDSCYRGNGRDSRRSPSPNRSERRSSSPEKRGSYTRDSSASPNSRRYRHESGENS